MNKTALLDSAKNVYVLGIDWKRDMALITNGDGGEFEVSLDRLDITEDEILDLSPLEW
jgi:hypothetical protein